MADREAPGRTAQDGPAENGRPPDPGPRTVTPSRPGARFTTGAAPRLTARPATGPVPRQTAREGAPC